MTPKRILVDGNSKTGRIWRHRCGRVLEVFFAEALDSEIDSAGVKNIEAFFGQPLGAGLKDSFGTSMSVESRAKVKQLLQSKGIQIVAMGVIAPDGREEWKKAFDLAKEFGLSYITAEPVKTQWDIVDSLAGAVAALRAVYIHDHPKTG